MKAVILAGGRGTRLSEETVRRPKPMVEIGGKPMLWHIMKIYSAHGIHDFIICCGYKGYMIKEYFANYFLHNSDVTFDLAKNEMTAHQSTSEPWRVTLVDTGDETATGGRMKLVRDHLDGDAFCFTYGDAVADVDVEGVEGVRDQSLGRDRLADGAAVGEGAVVAVGNAARELRGGRVEDAAVAGDLDPRRDAGGESPVGQRRRLEAEVVDRDRHGDRPDDGDGDLVGPGGAF